ncbi:MAG: cysteine peptidase family C39 domain-containing protein [Gemmataceae bacterium]
MNSTPEPDPPWTSPFEELLRSESVMYNEPPTNHDAHRPPPLFGTPIQDAGFWDGQQQYPDDCAIKCQQFILEQFTGTPADEHVLVREAYEHGWYAPGAGTSPQDVGKLLELHGVSVHSYHHASGYHLALELAQGHKVIVGVDAKELWEGNSILEEIRDAMGFAEVNHAVVVSGIDTSDPDHIRVLVSDPGTGQAIAAYPMEQFLDAWHDSDFFLVATNEPAPPHLPEMAHFDYQLGHLPEVADLPYDDFLTFSDHPSDWSNLVHHYVEVHHHLHVHHHFNDGLAAGHPSADFQDIGPADGCHDLLPDHLHGDVPIDPASDFGHPGDDLFPHDPF